MSMSVEKLTRRFTPVFSSEQANVLAEAIHDAYADLVKAGDFNELKEIVRELAMAQVRTEVELRQLAQELGGLSRSASYALENEAYRQLPAYLAAHHNIVLDQRLVRTEIGGEEVDLFALGHRNGTPVVLVGETKLQLDPRRGSRAAVAHALEQLERKVAAVQLRHPDREVVRLLVTHYARPVVREEAEKRAVIVVQSFEW